MYLDLYNKSGYIDATYLKVSHNINYRHLVSNINDNVLSDFQLISYEKG